METEDTSVRNVFLIKDFNAPKRRFFGWAYVAKKNGEIVEDHSGDIVDTPEAVEALEDAFYRYALESRDGDENHTAFGVAKLIENQVMSPEKAAAMGLPNPEDVPTGVWTGYQVPEGDAGDRLLEGIASGRYKALSIVGSGRREPVDA